MLKNLAPREHAFVNHLALNKSVHSTNIAPTVMLTTMFSGLHDVDLTPHVQRQVINAHRSQVFGVSEGLIDDKHIHKRLSINTRYLQHTYFNTRRDNLA